MLVQPKLLLIFVLLFQFSKANSQTIDVNAIDLYAQKLTKEFSVPGLSIGIVRNDSILFMKGYGLRELEKDLPVSENTIFSVGSISKTFTALTLGILVDQEKINWDDRVRKYLPYFELYDPYVTENFTIRDLLTHRSGLPMVSGGTLWYHSDLSRTDVIKKLRYLKPVSGFREKAEYQNVMFLVASEVVKAVSGMSWDDFLKVNVFDKLKMKNSTSVSTVREENKNIARPYIINKNFEKVLVEQEKGDNIAPAALIYSSAFDMVNYLRMLLNDGTFGKDTVISKSVLHEMFKPQIIFPYWPGPMHNQFSSYGLGWWITPVRNHIVIDHSGSVDGMLANMVMIKDLNIGIIVLSNTTEMVPLLLTWKLLEQIFNDKSFDVYERIKNFNAKEMEMNEKDKLLIEQTRIPNTKPSLNLNSYKGTYNDKMYGDILIDIKNKNLEIRFSHTPLFTGKLVHWHHDTFKIEWKDERVPSGFLTFNFDSQQKITGITLEQPDLLDVNFKELEIKKIE